MNQNPNYEPYKRFPLFGVMMGIIWTIGFIWGTILVAPTIENDFVPLILLALILLGPVGTAYIVRDWQDWRLIVKAKLPISKVATFSISDVPSDWSVTLTPATKAIVIGYTRRFEVLEGIQRRGQSGSRIFGYYIKLRVPVKFEMGNGIRFEIRHLITEHLMAPDESVEVFLVAPGVAFARKVHKEE